MNKKTIFLVIAATLLYLIFYILISNKASSTDHWDSGLSGIPIITYPVCEEDDTAIILLKSQETLCKSTDTLYTRAQGKKKVVKNIDSNVQYFPSAIDLVISENSENLVIEKLTSTNTFETVYLLPIKKYIVPVSVLIFNNENITSVFVSAQKTAHTYKDIKSILYRITFSTLDYSNATLSTFESIDTLKLTNVFENGTLLLMREMFPFLLEKHRFVEWVSSPKITNILCPEQEIPYMTEDVKIHDYVCQHNKDEFIHSNRGDIIFNGKESALQWQPKDSNALIFLSTSTSPEEWELIAKYTTRNGKRVYNCFDFTESLQITLSTCILEL